MKFDCIRFKENNDEVNQINTRQNVIFTQISKVDTLTVASKEVLFLTNKHLITIDKVEIDVRKKTLIIRPSYIRNFSCTNLYGRVEYAQKNKNFQNVEREWWWLFSYAWFGSVYILSIGKSNSLLLIKLSLVWLDFT